MPTMVETVVQPATSINNIIRKAPADSKRIMQGCTTMYLMSIGSGTPTFFLPKDIGDQLGIGKLSEMADRISDWMDTDVAVVLDKTINTFRLAPPEFLYGKWEIAYYQTVRKRQTYQIPLRKWERVIDLGMGAKYIPSDLNEKEGTPEPRFHIKRITNAFILYRRDQKRLTQKENPHANLFQIAITIAEKWAYAPIIEKTKYINEAHALKFAYIRANNNKLPKSPKLSSNSLLRRVPPQPTDSSLSEAPGAPQ